MRVPRTAIAPTAIPMPTPAFAPGLRLLSGDDRWGVSLSWLLPPAPVPPPPPPPPLLVLLVLLPVLVPVPVTDRVGPSVGGGAGKPPGVVDSSTTTVLVTVSVTV